MGCQHCSPNSEMHTVCIMHLYSPMENTTPPYFKGNRPEHWAALRTVQRPFALYIALQTLVIVQYLLHLHTANFMLLHKEPWQC